MTNTPGSVRTLGTLLRAPDGTGDIRLVDRFPTGAEDLWSALTEPARLARWLGEIEGDLRPGGEYRAHYFASGWEGRCRIDLCEPPRQLRLRTLSDDGAERDVEVTLTADGDETVLVVDIHGLPLADLAAYGAGNQVHVEDLASYLAGGERCDPRVRWQELHPAWQELAAGLA